MTISLQIRNVPEDTRDRIAEQARRQGKSVQAYLLEMIEREARFSDNPAVFDRTAHLRKKIPTDLSVDIARETRDGGADIDREQLG